MMTIFIKTQNFFHRKGAKSAEDIRFMFAVERPRIGGMQARAVNKNCELILVACKN
jgi:hypothetical protein